MYPAAPGIASFPGIAGEALNRCDLPALQHKELKRTSKEQPHSLVDSRLRGVEMGSGGQKRIALDSNIKGLC